MKLQQIIRCSAIVSLSLVLTQVSSRAATVSVFAPGKANPYLAGMPNGTTAPGGDSAPGQSPLEVTGLGLSTSSYLTFSATGTASYNGGTFYGPDGGPIFSRGSENGISGARLTTSALIGVFLDSQLPTTSAAPADLNFELIGRDFLTLSPMLKQVFFIGDGVTSSSTVQKFYIPTGATRLFLGTADGTQWVNNAGGFNTTVTSFSSPAVPEPTSLAVFATLMLVTGGMRKSPRFSVRR